MFIYSSVNKYYELMAKNKDNNGGCPLKYLLYFYLLSITISFAIENEYFTFVV